MCISSIQSLWFVTNLLPRDSVPSVRLLGMPHYGLLITEVLLLDEILSSKYLSHARPQINHLSGRRYWIPTEFQFLNLSQRRKRRSSPLRHRSLFLWVFREVFCRCAAWFHGRIENLKPGKDKCGTLQCCVVDCHNNLKWSWSRMKGIVGRDGSQQSTLKSKCFYK